MEPIIDHIEITVKDMSVAVPFYDKLLPLLGFDVRSRGSAVIEEHEKHVVWYEHPRLGFTITSPRRAFVGDRKSTRLNSSHSQISYAVFCLKKKKISTSPP